MFDTYIRLESIDRVKKFVSVITNFDADFELMSGKYIINAKSILGIFSLDLSKPVLLRINAEGSALGTIREAIADFVVPV